MNINKLDFFPELPYQDWLDTKTTLHIYTQIIGKIRLALHPFKNHWWHVTLSLTPRGLTTGPIPYGHSVFSIEFDFIAHQLKIITPVNEPVVIALQQANVASFYHQVFEALKKLGIEVKINTAPFDPSRVNSDIPFDVDEQHGTYQPEYATRFHQILTQIYPVFAQLNSNFLGKVTPIHLYWHTFDYVLTFFSGRKGPDVSAMDIVSQGAYSHEVISFGFWPGDSKVPQASFYSYTYPEPEKLEAAALVPTTAEWVATNGSHMALLSYDDMRQSEQPAQTLLEFFQSAFKDGSTLAKWQSTDLLMSPD